MKLQRNLRSTGLKPPWSPSQLQRFAKLLEITLGCFDRLEHFQANPHLPCIISKHTDYIVFAPNRDITLGNPTVLN